MARFAAYNTTTGEIDHIRETTWFNLQRATIPAGHQFLNYSEDLEITSEQFYVDLSTAEPAVKARPTFGVSSDVAVKIGKTVSIPLPTGTKVTFRGTQGQTTGEPLEVEGIMADTYQIKLEKWPYQPQTVSVAVS